MVELIIPYDPKYTLLKVSSTDIYRIDSQINKLYCLVLFWLPESLCLLKSISGVQLVWNISPGLSEAFLFFISLTWITWGCNPTCSSASAQCCCVDAEGRTPMRELSTAPLHWCSVADVDAALAAPSADDVHSHAEAAWGLGEGGRRGQEELRK